MFIDCKLIDDKIYLSERGSDGVRRVTHSAPPYVFYLEDKAGTIKALDGTRCRRIHHTSRIAHERSVSKWEEDGRRTFEKDVDPVYRFLEETFRSNDIPDLHITFFDIEADKDPVQGWSQPDNPFTPITAITLYNKWEDQFYTIATPPDTLSFDEARALLDSNPDSFGELTLDKGYILVETEEEMLLLFLELIEDCDCLCGYNSRFYDIPYTINRIRHVLGKEPLDKIKKENGTKEHPFNPSAASTKLLCRLNLFPELPKMHQVVRYGGLETIYELSGRIHLDYLELYKKFTQEPKHSYTLDSVLNDEIGQTKVKYEGSLDVLQRKDFRTFIAYSRQDVAGLSALDDAKKLINLASNMSHMAGVTYDKVFGSVTIIEQAILKQLHKKKIVGMNKTSDQREDTSVPGAYVRLPKGGLVEWVFSVDINSLYPSIIRALNISPETVIGQFELKRTTAKFLEYMKDTTVPIDKRAPWAWAQFTGVLEYHDIIDERPYNLTLHFEDGTSADALASEWKEILRENKWCVSANGTVFDLSKKGIVPECLDLWYNERVEFQNKKKKYKKLAAKGDDKKHEYDMQVDYYDQLQYSRKIFLNSVYGSLLNVWCRFYDSRCGRSVTLTGRVITKGMIENIQSVINDRL